MTKFKEGDRVEYAAHPVSWQAGHNETEIPWHQADGRKPLPATLSAEHAEEFNVHARKHSLRELEPVEEEWRGAKVVAVKEHPTAPHLNRHEPEVVLTLADNDGHPPFDINALLVRKPRRS